MSEILAFELTPKGVSIRRNGSYLEAWEKARVKFLGEINLSTKTPDAVYDWIKEQTGLEQHDFELRIEYPPMHPQHPKRMLPLVLGEVRKPYLHVFE